MLLALATSVINDKQKKEPSAWLAVLFVVLVLLTLFVVVMAIRTAQTCGNSLWSLLAALLFPELYLLQFGFRKFLIKESGYCPRLTTPGGQGSFVSFPQ